MCVCVSMCAHGCVYVCVCVCMCVCMCVHHAGAVISTECIFSYKCHMLLQHWFSSKQLEYTIVIIIAAEKPKCRDSLTLLHELEMSSWYFLFCFFFAKLLPCLLFLAAPPLHIRQCTAGWDLPKKCCWTNPAITCDIYMQPYEYCVQVCQHFPLMNYCTTMLCMIMFVGKTMNFWSISKKEQTQKNVSVNSVSESRHLGFSAAIMITIVHAGCLV